MHGTNEQSKHTEGAEKQKSSQQQHVPIWHCRHTIPSGMLLPLIRANMCFEFLIVLAV